MPACKDFRDLSFMLCVGVMQGAGDTNIHMVRVVSNPQRRRLRGSCLKGESEITLWRRQSQPDEHPRKRSGMVRVQGCLPQQAS